MSFISHFIRKYARPACYGFAVVLLVACGGGGGGDAGLQATAPTTPIQITQANGQEVADTATDSYGTVYAIEETGLLAVGGGSQRRLNLVDIAKLAIEFSQQRPAGGNTVAPAVTVNCPENNGTATYPDPDVFPIGTFSFNNCGVDGFVFNGQFTVAGTDNATSFNGSFTYSSFSISQGGSELFNISGALNVSVSWSGNIDTGTITSSLLVIRTGGEVHDITNLNISFTDNYNTSVYSEDFSYTVSSTSLGGSVTVATTQTVVSNWSDPYPYAGQAVITGANGTKTRITALGSGSPSGLVSVEIDATGGGYGTPQVMTWAVFDDSGII